MLHKLSALAFLLVFLIPARAQKAKLFAGPVVGSVTTNSAKVWIGYSGKGKNAVVLGDTATKHIYYPTDYSYLASNGVVALTFNFTGLQAGHVYNVLVSIEGWKSQARVSFRTQTDTPVRDFSFSLGSCAKMNTDWSRPFYPGGKAGIFNAIRHRPNDFMLWLGDNVYYSKPRHFNTVAGMFDRNMKVRSAFKKFRFFLMSMPQYAIWDLHDFGPDDATADWQMKDSSLMVFKSFWPNTYPEQTALRGNYFSFRYYDAEFFMTDDRYFRQPSLDSSAIMLGTAQMAWLKNKLLLSDATFKFIVIGSQVLNANNYLETFSRYPKEKAELIDFITTNNIKGVLFLSGSHYYSEISRSLANGYPLIEFTSAPLTAPLLPRRLVGAYRNVARLTGTNYGRHSFGRISISGPAGKRLCNIQVINRWGKEVHRISISQTDLQRQ